jgi:hypothetical protein
MARHVERHPWGCVLWARKPYAGRYGLCVAVRLREGRLSVGIRRPGFIEWLPAKRALTEREAESWARSGF